MFSVFILIMFVLLFIVFSVLRWYIFVLFWLCIVRIFEVFFLLKYDLDDFCLIWFKLFNFWLNISGLICDFLLFNLELFSVGIFKGFWFVLN